MKLKLLLSVILTYLVSNMALASLDEGIEYKLVTPAQPTITKKKIEVIEFFWYACPHCYEFEPVLNDWLKNKPENVVFYRIPAVFSQNWALHARAFYAAKSLGLFENGKTDFHKAFFEQIHEKKNPLSNKKAIQKVFSQFKISNEDFNNTFDSFAVNTKVNRAATLSKRFQLDGVPTMIINGKYRTDGPMAGGRKGIIKVMNYLISKETKK